MSGLNNFFLDYYIIKKCPWLLIWLVNIINYIYISSMIYMYISGIYDTVDKMIKELKSDMKVKYLALRKMGILNCS